MGQYHWRKRCDLMTKMNKVRCLVHCRLSNPMSRHYIGHIDRCTADLSRALCRAPCVLFVTLIRDLSRPQQGGSQIPVFEVRLATLLRRDPRSAQVSEFAAHP